MRDEKTYPPLSPNFVGCISPCSDPRQLLLRPILHPKKEMPLNRNLWAKFIDAVVPQILLQKWLILKTNYIFLQRFTRTLRRARGRCSDMTSLPLAPSYFCHSTAFQSISNQLQSLYRYTLVPLHARASAKHCPHVSCFHLQPQEALHLIPQPSLHSCVRMCVYILVSFVSRHTNWRKWMTTTGCSLDSQSVLQRVHGQ